MNHVLLVGAGTIGSSWATFFLSRGLHVVLYDPDTKMLRSAKKRVEVQLHQLLQAGEAWSVQVKKDVLQSAPARLSLTGDLNDHFADGQKCDFVQESVPERYDIKQAVYEELDRLIAPDVPVCSSSSGLLISRLQSFSRFPGRYLIAHPFNPPHLIPLVEIVPGPASDKEIVDKVYGAFKAWGKTPIILNKEVPGHVANRLAAALWREAISLVVNGVASVGDVDRALSAGPGLRWAIMGAHMTYHLGGGDGGIRHFWKHLGPAFESYFMDLDSSTSLSPETLELLEEGLAQELRAMGNPSLSELAARRDRRLLEILSGGGFHE